ncbi:MAG: HAMP domain-containing protein [Clostridia bacterium]|nr:HAMP domain-containing protein [Clostridia bacterium]
MRSVFLRRLLAALIIAMLLVAICVVFGYMFLSREVYADIKMQEMLPKAEAAKQLFVEYKNQNMTADAFDRVCEQFMSAAASDTVIVDSQGDIIYHDDSTLSITTSQLKQDLQIEIEEVLSGENVSKDRVKMRDSGDAIVVGVPLNDDSGNVIAGILLIKPLDDVFASSAKMATVLFWIIIIVVPITVLGLSVKVRKVAAPLHDMAEAAIEMSRGNFDIRVNEKERGEVGLLASALNNLCEALSKTVYQLRSEKGQLDQILQSLSDGVAATDQAGKLVHCNSALMRMFGAVSVEKREDLLHDSALWDKFDEVYETGSTQTVTLNMPGDRTVWITISPVVTEDNERVGVVGLFKDMTEMERLEKMRREYVANVSHELRTPLTSIRGLLEPLADGMVKDEEDKQRYYKIMLHEVVRLSRLINDMLKLSRLQSGADYTEYTRVDIVELLNDVVSSYTAGATQKGIQLLLDADYAPDALTDPDLVEQVLVILIDNAIKYTPPGGSITLSVKDGEKLLVSVTDTGVGISEEDKKHIFERFYKVDKSHGEGGTGLGLSIAATIIERLQENITVDSVEGEGTCFTFTLKKFVSSAIRLGPANEQRNISFAEDVSKRTSDASDDSKTQKIKDAEYLVIDDNDNRENRKKTARKRKK